MNIWVDSRRTLVLREAASHIGSTMQQVYFSLNHITVPNGTVATQKLGVPPFIENRPYTGNATLNPALNSSKVLEITFRLGTIGTAVTTSVVLGQNFEWVESTFVSNSTNACIIANKTDGTITMFFGG